VRANLQYFQKHYGGLGGLGFLVATGIHEVVRIAAYGLLYVFNRYQRPASAHKVQRSLSCLKWLAGVPMQLQQPAGKQV